MPVKVRCTNCEKVLNAPDTARGKAIKCPGCQSRISVPAEGTGGGGAASKKAKVKKPVDEDDAFLSNLDLEKSIDTEAAICPKCGADIDEETIECPACGVDVKTGQLSAKRQRKLGMKGPDPDDYYKVAIPDSWRFMLAHPGYAAKSATISTILLLVVGGLVWGIAKIPAEKWPPRMFLAAFAIATYMAIPGWYWHVFMATVHRTMGKKDDLKDVKFDMVTSMAEGIMATLWSTVYFLPATFLGAFLVTVVGAKVDPADSTSLLIPLGLFYGPSLLTCVFVPPAIAHLASFSQWRGWLLPVMLTKAVRVPGQCLLWMVTAFIGSLISLVFVVGGIFAWTGFIYGALGPFLRGMKQVAAEAGQQAQEIVNYGALGMAFGALLALAYIIFFMSAFGTLFTARSAGLFAQFCRDKLDLVTKPSEQKWVSKARKLDDDGNPITPVWVQIAGIMGVSVLFAVAAYIVMRQMGGQ